MFAKPEQVRGRRLRRRLKAAASIVVALAAGAFLACHRGVEEVKQAVDAARGKASDGSGLKTDAGIDASYDGGADGTDGGADGAADGKSDAIAKYDAPRTDAAVDVGEHRKGMPVPDNLLE